MGKNETANLPCYGQCCGPLHEGKAWAETAEQLMRSRFSAFVLENEDYLLASWHPDKRPASLEFDPQIKWLGLNIKATQAGQKSDIEGWVKFVARYKIAGKAGRIEEYSYFIKDNERWLYVDAVNDMDAQ